MQETNIIFELFGLFISLVISFIAINHFSNNRYSTVLKYHTFWPRFWSPTIDGVVLWPLTTLLPMMFYKVVDVPLNRLWLVSAVVTVIQFSYAILMNGRYGGTIGKLQCNLRILDSKTEAPITYRQALIRDAIPLILILALCVYSTTGASNIEDMTLALWITGAFGVWFLAEILTMFTNAKRRALHDFIAGTVVVRTNIVDVDEPGSKAGEGAIQRSQRQIGIFP